MLSYAQKTTYDLPDPSLISQWKRKLSEREIQWVESRVANMLVDRGYELSGLPSLKVTSAMERQLKLQSWWVRVQGRVQRYGIALFLADYLSRRLKINFWQKRVRQKLNAINKSRLK